MRTLGSTEAIASSPAEPRSNIVALGVPMLPRCTLRHLLRLSSFHSTPSSHSIGHTHRRLQPRRSIHRNSEPSQSRRACLRSTSPPIFLLLGHHDQPTLPVPNFVSPSLRPTGSSPARTEPSTRDEFHPLRLLPLPQPSSSASPTTPDLSDGDAVPIVRTLWIDYARGVSHRCGRSHRGHRRG
jgi:hypothetical protein